jgi:hypothetical protein
MDMTAALIVNIILGLVAFTGIAFLAAWGIRTGERGNWRRPFEKGRRSRPAATVSG